MKNKNMADDTTVAIYDHLDTLAQAAMMQISMETTQETQSCMLTPSSSSPSSSLSLSSSALTPPSDSHLDQHLADEDADVRTEMSDDIETDLTVPLLRSYSPPARLNHRHRPSKLPMDAQKFNQSTYMSEIEFIKFFIQSTSLAEAVNRIALAYPTYRAVSV